MNLPAKHGRRPMKWIAFFFVIALLISIAAYWRNMRPTARVIEPIAVQAEEANDQLGELKIRFQYAGDAFAAAPIQIGLDHLYCGSFPIVNEQLLVHPQNRGIKNVVVYLYTGRGGSKLPELTLENQTHTIASEKCRFEPHVLIAKVGDTLKVTNRDQVAHNANLAFLNNMASSLSFHSGQDRLIELREAEPAPIPVSCNIHPWMSAYVVILDHPFAAISDENGELTISGLPVGEKLVFRAFHEAGSMKVVSIDGQQTHWRRNLFEVDVQAGVTDLGTVMVPAEALTVD